MTITYRNDIRPTAEAVAEVFRSSGIRRPVDDLKRIQAMIDHADLVHTAWDGDRLVGIGRSLTDHRYCCYLSDLAVRGDYQRRGIGKELIARLRASLSDECMLLLLSAPNAMTYYPHVGFEKIENAFLIQRKH